MTFLVYPRLSVPSEHVASLFDLVRLRLAVFAGLDVDSLCLSRPAEDVMVTPNAVTVAQALKQTAEIIEINVRI